MSHINKLLIPVSSTANLETATSAIPNNSILYDKDSESFYAKYNGVLVMVGKSTDWHFEGDISSAITAWPTGASKGTVYRLLVQSTIDSVIYPANTLILYAMNDSSGNAVWIAINRTASDNVDNVNIVINSSGQIALADNVTAKTATITPVANIPSMNTAIDFGTTTTSKTVLLLCKSSSTSYGAIGGQLLEYAATIHSLYHFSLSANGSRFIDGSSSYKDKAYFVKAVYDNNDYIGIKFPSGIPAQIEFQGWDSRDADVMPPETYTDSSFTSIVQIVSTSSSASKEETINTDSVNYSWEFNTANTSLETSVSHAGTDFGDGLTVLDTATCLSKQYTSLSLGGNTGAWYIANSNVNGYFKLTVASACTINFAISSTTTATRNMLLKDSSLNTLVTVTSTTGTSLFTGTYTYTGTTEATFYLCNTGGGLYVWYINTTGTTTDASSAISSLDETGEDGDPHQIVITGTLTAAQLIAIANSCKNSLVQIDLDMSNATVADDAKVWSSKNSLNTVFRACVSLRSFKMPQGVTSIDGAAWSGCTFLREITLNNDITSITGGGSSWNDGVFSSTRILDLTLPTALQTLGQYVIRDSNIKNLIVPKSSKYVSDSLTTLYMNWASLSYARTDMVIKVPQDFLTYVTNNSGFYWWTNKRFAFSDDSTSSPSTRYELYS
jgi:hypothetical protein